jgi:hypothetical protein
VGLEESGGEQGQGTARVGLLGAMFLTCSPSLKSMLWDLKRVVVRRDQVQSGLEVGASAPPGQLLHRDSLTRSKKCVRNDSVKYM